VGSEKSGVRSGSCESHLALTALTAATRRQMEERRDFFHLGGTPFAGGRLDQANDDAAVAHTR
jgi:hypothetical protein